MCAWVLLKVRLHHLDSAHPSTMNQPRARRAGRAHAAADGGRSQAHRRDSAGGARSGFVTHAQTRSCLSSPRPCCVARAALARTPAGHAVLREAGMRLDHPVVRSAAVRPAAVPAHAIAPTAHHGARALHHPEPFSCYTKLPMVTECRRNGSPRRPGCPPGHRQDHPAPRRHRNHEPCPAAQFPRGQVRITVRLASPAESVYFLADCLAATK